MKRFLAVVVSVGALAVLVGSAVAQMEHGSGQDVHGKIGHMGGAGHGMMGGPGMATTGTQITEDKAKELAQQYADKNLAGFKVERVLPSTGMPHTMYSVELKNAKGELRNIRITPFGGVMPFSGPAGRS